MGLCKSGNEPPGSLKAYQHSPLLNPPFHNIPYCHSFISCQPSPHSLLGKILVSCSNGVKSCRFHWTLSLSEHSLGQNGTGMTDHNPSALSSAYYLQNESWSSASGGGTVIDGLANLNMTSQGSFHINHCPY